MSIFRFLIQSLLHYWRTNVAMLAGVIAGTAVIGGALIVGDSVRGSLQQMSLDRLGEIDHVLNAQRFFRENLAEELAADPQFQARFAAAAPAILMPGGLESARTEESGERRSRRVGNVNIFCLDGRLWELTDHGGREPPQNDEVVLSSRVGEQLDVDAGDTLTLWIEIPASIPRDTLLGRRDQTSVEIPLVVREILPADSGLGRLNLNPHQQLPLNAFVSLEHLQSLLGLAATRERDPRLRRIVSTPARVNSLFVRAKSPEDGRGEQAPSAANSLTAVLAEHVRLEDLHLRVVENEEFDYLSLESEQQILGSDFARAGKAAADKLNLKFSPVFVYLANKLVNTEDESAFSRYSIVAGLDFTDEPPLGPFVFEEGAKLDTPLGDNGIVINEWLQEDLQVSVGDQIRLTYHVVGAQILAEEGRLPEESIEFTVRGIAKLDETPAADRGLTPRVKGITDVESYDEWDEPFPMEPVTERDEAYWEEYRATPKAFISLQRAQELWRSRYGELTSLRVSKLPQKTLTDSAAAYSEAVLAALTPAQTGLIFQPVKYTGLQAASGTTDFSGLFIGFSFFLILSATILIGLLFRLGIERRSTSVGLLAAVGFTPKKVRGLFMAEGLIVVGLGGVLGLAAAVGYASLMVYGLKTWWYGAIGTRFLYVYLKPVSLITGLAISVVIASLAVWWAMRKLRLLSTRDLLAGATEPALSVEARRTRGRNAGRVGAVSVGLSLLLLLLVLLDVVPNSEAFSGLSWQVVAFFVVGMALLTASLAFLSAWLDADRSAAVRGGGLAGMGRLGMRNAARNRQRSVFTVGLIASATFVIVAVAAGHRNPAAERPDKNSGNGGYTLIAESSVPILYDLNTPQGRRDAGFRLPQSQTEESEQLLEQMNVMPFRVRPGEDASCLNLYRTQLPTILGVPQRMIERDGFKFANAERENPWTRLNEKPDENVIPVLGDMNTLMYSLKKGIGDEIPVPPDAAEADFRLQIAGMFDGSVFQGVLLMSEENFQQRFPEQAGYQYFLIECPPERAEEVTDLLETGLADKGFDAEPVARRLQDFLAVQNTYLSTFQTLGGLGLLLGTFGLATVMLRNVLERRTELALLRAVGFRNNRLAWLVLWENAFLLLWGLLAGAASALLAMAGHLRSTGADVPWTGTGLMLVLVLVVGMLAALLAVTEAVRTPIVSTLRSE